jgi:hypothetical protein
VIASPPPSVVSRAENPIRDEQRARTIAFSLTSSTKSWEVAARDTYTLSRDRSDTEGFLRWLKEETKTIIPANPDEGEDSGGLPITTGFRLLHSGRALTHGYKGTQARLEKVGQLLSRDDTAREEIDRALGDGSLDDLFWRKTGRGLPRVQLKARIRELDRQILAVVKGINPRAKGPDSRELVYEFAASFPQEFSVFVQEHAGTDGAE